MATADEGALTLGEAAERLGMDIEALLEVLYRREIPAALQQGTGRLLLDRHDVDLLMRRRQAEHAES